MRISSYIRRLSYVVPPLLKVKRSEPTVVLPAKSTPRELKPLSCIDDTNSMMFQVPTLMQYKHKSSMTGTDPVKVIREAQAKALVPYYPFAGRLVEGPNSGLIVDCRSEGVAFIEAAPDAKVDQVIDTMMESGGNPPIDQLLQDVTTYSGILGYPLRLFQALEVRRHAPVLVTPAKPTPRELKQLSDIDFQKALRFQAPVMLLYKNNPCMTGKDPAEVFRKALAEVLVPYYPFAGKLVQGDNQKLFVDCNSEGIPFIEADTSAKVEDIIGMIESGREPFFEELLPDVPGSGGILGCPLWLFQVTRFKCGGFSLGAYFNHTITDGTGLAQFLCAIAEYVRGETVLSTPPVWQRECFLAREPPRITCQHLEFEQIENVSPETTVERQKSMIFKSFYFGQEKITALKNYLHNQSGEKYTSYEIVTACLWRCRTRALKTDPDQIVEFSCVVNGRYIKELEVPHGYYGNVIACPSVFSKSETLCTNPLEYATDLVRKAKAKLSGEYVRSTMDHIVSKGGEYWTEWKYVASDNRRLGVYEADFGWGKPLIGGGVKGNFLLTFYLGYKEGVLVPMCLPETVMARFELEFNNLMNSVS